MELKRRKRITVQEEIALPTPTDLCGLKEAIDAVASSLNSPSVSAYKSDAVSVSVNSDGEIVFRYTLTTGEPAEPEPKAEPEPEPPTATEADAPAVVPPFPTSPEAKPLPELTVENAHKAVQHAGTFYFNLPAEVQGKDAQRYRQRIKSAAKSQRRKGDDVLVDAKIVRASDALEVTVVRGNNLASVAN